MDKHYYAGHHKKAPRVTLAEDKYGWTIYVFGNQTDCREFLSEHAGDPHYMSINRLWADTLWKYSHVINYSK